MPDTANFVNFRAWEASIELLLEVGIDRVEAHDLALATRLVEGLTERGFEVRSPRQEEARSAIVVASHPDEGRNEELFGRLGEAGVNVAMRAGALRFSPHLYNGEADIDGALAALGQ